jgi:glucose/mannose-6-phosphate isomerase
MLDDLMTIEKYDKQDALGIIASQPGQLRQHYDLVPGDWDGIDRVVLAGMGGSALAAEFFRSWLSDRLVQPLEIVRDYRLPAYVTRDTLLVVSSYSGNTEESLAALAEAKKRGIRVVIMTAGGQLAEAAKAEGYPLLLTPSGYQPRLAVLYGVRALSQLFTALGLLDDVTPELEAAADWAESHTQNWLASSPTATNQAKQIAEKLVGFPVVVYGGPTLGLPAMKWKIDFNENSKNVAFYYQLPEFDHNEFQGWLFPREKHLKVIQLESSLDHPRVQKRFDVSDRLLSGIMPNPIRIQAVGETKLQQMLWTLLLGDFTSAYLAFLNGIDPTPVDLVERFKKELG